MHANVEDRGIKGDITPLMAAASGGYVDIVKLLLVHGADVNAQSSTGENIYSKYIKRDSHAYFAVFVQGCRYSLQVQRFLKCEIKTCNCQSIKIFILYISN